jgi:pectate lyase
MKTLHVAAFVVVGLAALRVGAEVEDYLGRGAEWYGTAEARGVAEVVLSYQTERGDWPKNVDTAGKEYAGDRGKLKGTFDNGATVGELRFLGRVAGATGEERYIEAFHRGLELVLGAQYGNGGWPQSVGAEGYSRHITFNDETMVRLLRLVNEVATEPVYGFVAADVRKRCAEAFERGIECVLNSQTEVKGELTVWCAQHDEVTLKPAKARAYELPSLSGGESAGILMLLMEIERPSERVKRAVRAGAAWYEKAKVTGVRLERKADPAAPKGFDVVVVEDASAPPLWARFYDLETGRPFYCGRDGVKKATLAEVELERRAGYAWLRPWGVKVAERYAEWGK